MKNEEEIEATVGELPQTVDYLPEKLKALGCFKEELLIYRDTYYRDPLTGEKHNGVNVVCTKCHEEFVAEKHRVESCHNGWAPAPFGYIDPEYRTTVMSGESCACPLCGAKAKAVHVGTFRSVQSISTEWCATIHKIRNHLAFLEWSVSKWADKNGDTFFTINGHEGMMIVDGNPVRLVKYFNNCGTICQLSEWVYRQKFHERIGEYPVYKIFYEENDIITSECANSALDVYIKTSKANCYPGAYLATWCKYPNVENLIRQNLTNYTNNCIGKAYEMSGSYYSTYKTFTVNNLIHHLKLKKAKPHEILGCDKRELPAFRLFKPSTVDTWLLLRGSGTKLPLNEIVNLEQAGTDFSAWRELTKEPFRGFNVPVLRTMHYIIKQRNRQQLAVNKSLINIGYIRDYWYLLYRLSGRIDPALRFPKDIIHEHDRVNEDLIVKENTERELKQQKEFAELDLEIAKRTKRIANHCFADEELGLSIRPCRSCMELINEGSALHHCVGGYRNKVARGETMIYFIRRIIAPDVPYYTLEYQDKKIKQDHGDRNVLQTDAILEFEKKWLAHLASLEGAKNEKRNRKSAEQSGRA